MPLRIYTKNEHLINKAHIDRDALDALQKLKEAGHTAYLVGGSVRDLLLGKTPKDFDISTSAKPDEIKKLFQRQCILIGRRFRLAHIRYGKKILETSTFRSGDTTTSSLIVRDNRFGTEEEDVLRRDFTINALFYNPQDETILDYVGGFEDTKKKLLRTVGKPIVRFKQDPVRMIRLLKFQARFSFHFHEEEAFALKKCYQEITKSAPARVLEEIFKMLESSCAEPFFRLLKKHKMLSLLFPCFHHFFSSSHEELAFSYLQALDHIMKEKEMLDRSTLFSALIFPILEQEIISLIQDRQEPINIKEISHLTHNLLHGISTSSFTHFPKKLLYQAYANLINQFRLTPLKSPPKFHTHFNSPEDFFFAVELLKVRSRVDKELLSFYDEWKKTYDKRYRSHEKEKQ